MSGFNQARKRFLAAVAFLAAAFALIPAQPGFAQQRGATMTLLKQIQVSSGSRIDLLFDGRIGKSQLKTEFFNNVIQLSLSDVSVYPAKIAAVNGGSLVKVFAYQYAPKLVRCRITVRGNAADFKDRFQVSAHGRMMTLALADPAATAAAPSRSLAPLAMRHDAVKETPKEREDETSLLERVMKGAPSVSRAKAAAPTTAPVRAESKLGLRGERPEGLALAGGSPLPSPMGMLVKLAAVIGLFGALAFAFKKVSQLRASSGAGEKRLNARLARGEGGWMGALGGFARSAAQGLARKEKVIEVVSNHYLGPKKSISVVRVMGRTLVLGVTNESINLISQIGDGGSAAEEGAGLDIEELLAPGKAGPLAASGAQAAGRAVPVNFPGAKLPGVNLSSPASAGFSSLLAAEARKPAAASARARIRSRLEGLKQL